jgi:hypothetical protein
MWNIMIRRGDTKGGGLANGNVKQVNIRFMNWTSLLAVQRDLEPTSKRFSNHRLCG